MTLLPHQIARADVEPFLRGSALARTSFHASHDPANIRSIVEGGVDLARARDGRVGLGFYTAPEPISGFGPNVVEVAVRLERPLTGPSGWVRGEVDRLTAIRFGGDLPNATGPGRARVLADARRTALLEAGYDGVIPLYFDRAQEIAALHPESVRVVMPQGTQDAMSGATGVWRALFGFGT